MKLLVDLTSYNLKSLITALEISVYISIWCVRGTFLLDCVRFAGPFLFKTAQKRFAKTGAENKEVRNRKPISHK